MTDGTLSFHRAALDWHQLQDETECFFLRVYGPGDYRFKGADLGILITKGRLQTDEPEELTERAREVHRRHSVALRRNAGGAEVHPPPVSYLTSSSLLRSGIAATLTDATGHVVLLLTRQQAGWEATSSAGLRSKKPERLEPERHRVDRHDRPVLPPA